MQPRKPPHSQHHSLIQTNTPCSAWLSWEAGSRRLGLWATCSKHLSKEMHARLRSRRRSACSPNEIFRTSVIVQHTVSMLSTQQPSILDAFQAACNSSDLQIHAAKLTTLEALKPENAPRNRYTNVLPWDSTRVLLSTGGSNYINASHVKCCASHFIATQGPLPSTCQDFFVMLREQNVNLVIALGPAAEMGRVKFHEYWNHESVTIKSQRQLVGCAVIERACSVVVNGLQHDFVHLHAYDWPDHGVPQVVLSSNQKVLSKVLASHSVTCC
jgi:protein tyrosine phosphatase